MISYKLGKINYFFLLNILLRAVADLSFRSLSRCSILAFIFSSVNPIVKEECESEGEEDPGAGALLILDLDKVKQK